jgi:hypothetical protein
MATCGTCGSQSLYCSCLQSTQPFCNQCTEDSSCAQIMDAQCVIYHPDNDKASKLNNLAMPNGSSAEAIFEALDKFLGNNANVPITIIDTLSIDLTQSGVAGHTIKADIKISPDLNNQLEVRANGVFAKAYNENYLTKVNAADTPDYLANQIVGSTDGIVSISPVVENGQIKVKPSLDISCLFNAIKNDKDLLIQLCQLVDSCKCFISVSNLSATYAPACPTGYTLVGGVCTKTDSTPATVSSTLVAACPSSVPQYGAYGALVYQAGFYNAQGRGTGTNLNADLSAGHVVPITTADVWKSDNSTGDNNGPFNRAGVWACSAQGTGSLGFAVPINVPVSKTYYIAIAADDQFVLKVDNVTIVDTTGTDTSYWMGDSGAKFRYWHIYPVSLAAGTRIVELTGVDTGGVSSALAAEIYDNTLAELQAATLSSTFLADKAAYPLSSNVYSNVNLVFSTRCARSGTNFSIGNATCPDNTWTLDTSGGAVLTAPCQGINSNPTTWMCKRQSSTAFSGYTATVVWDKTDKAVNYQLQVKESGQPTSSYADVAGNPIAQPTSGSTVTKIVPGLSTNTKDFRVRCNYGTCQSEWTEAAYVIV